MVELRLGDDTLTLSWDEWETRVRAGRVPETALVRFEPATGDAFVPAGDLEMYRSLASHGSAAAAWRSSFAGTAPLLTALLVGVQLRLWWIAQFHEGVYWTALRDLTVFAPHIYEDGQVWRIFSMGFTQVDALHVGMNMLWLGYCGWNLERALGRTNLLVLYLGSVVAGSLFSMLGGPDSPSLGASGGVFGLVSASIVFGFIRTDVLPERGRRLFGWALLPYLVILFLSGLMNETTDNWGHLGGLVAGILLASVLDPPQLQRTPRWNRLWHGVVGGSTLLVLLVLGFAGPRVAPLRDSEVARQVALGRKGPALDVPAGALAYAVPVGWDQGRTVVQDLGFASPAGERRWSVQERRNDRPTPIADARETWLERVDSSFPDAEVTLYDDAELAGEKGLGARLLVREDGFPDRLVDYRVIGRGIWQLEAIWQVEVNREARLAPLERRLRASVTWAEPLALSSARIHFEHDPGSPKARDAWATALSEVGRADEALAIRLRLVEELPQVVAWWSGLLDLLAWYPDAVDDPEALWQRALDEHPTGAMAAAVARSLHTAGRTDEALGVLDIAWNQLPGERSLKRARRERGLSVVYSDGEPWDLVNDPLTGEPRPEDAVQAIRELTLTIDNARARAAALEAERRTIAEAGAAALREGDLEEAIRIAGWFREGTTELDEEARIKVQRDLHAAATRDRAPSWIPGEIATAARAAPPPSPDE